VCPSRLWSTAPFATPTSHVQLGNVSPAAGVAHPQKEKVTQAPVRLAAVNPARDLRDARGRRRSGTWRGRGGVSEPQRRPKVEAAVSAHERLRGRIKLKTGPKECRNEART